MIWFLAIYLPMGSDEGTGLFKAMASGLVGDVIVIPWSYVYDAYIRTPEPVALNVTAGRAPRHRRRREAE